MKRENLSRYFQFFLVLLAAGAIFPIAYLRTNYQETLLEVFSLTIQQLNSIYSFLGVVWVLAYIPSGFLADKFSTKKLLVISLFGTALGGLIFSRIPSYPGVVFVYCMWGVFTVFTFWAAHMKMVKMLAGENEEGRFFGILDGGRGVVEAFLGSISLIIFTSVMGDKLDFATKKTAIVSIIYMYSIILVLTGVLIAIFVKETKNVARTEDEKFKFSKLPLLLKNKNLYLHGMIIFFGYITYWTVYYLGGFLQSNVGVDPVTVGTVTVIVLWMRPVGGMIGGFLADKIGKITTIIIVLIGAICGLFILALLPTWTGKGMFYVVVVALAIFLYAIRGTYWSIIGNDGFSLMLMGTAIGAISFFGYLPDILLPQINSLIFNIFGAEKGYSAYFIFSALMGVVSIIVAMIYSKFQKEEE